MKVKLKTKVISLLIAALLLLGMAAVSFTIANASTSTDAEITDTVSAQY